MRLHTAIAAFLASTGVAMPQASMEEGFEDAVHTTSVGGEAKCVEGRVPIHAVSPKNIHLNLGIPTNQSMVTQSFVDMSTTGSNYTTNVIGKPNKVSGTYKIFAKLCRPAGSSSYGKTIQLLTHGVGFGIGYWDFAPGYSYVDTAAMHGYSTLAYDRLGVGQSEKPKASIQHLQAPLEVEIYHEIVKKLRSGQFAATTFKNVVGVGHSFGSELTVGVASLYPKALEVAILTGFSMSTAGQIPFLAGLNLQIASKNDPKRFGNLNNGYLVANNRISNQFAFLHEPGYPPEHLTKAEATKETVTPGELLTQMGIIKPSPKFDGGVAVVNGMKDLPFCSGDCSFPTNQAAKVQPALFPNAKKSMTHLAHAAGHGLNVHYSAEKAFEKIQSFVKSNGV